MARENDAINSELNDERRTFLRNIGAASVVGVTSVAAGCQSDDGGDGSSGGDGGDGSSGGDGGDGSSGGDGSDGSDGGDDVYGGRFITTFGADPLSAGGIQSHTSSGTWSRQLLTLFTEPLTRLTPDGEVEGRIAADWDLDFENNQVVYQIREGVQFHEPYDREVTAEDVVENYHQIMDPEYGSEVYAMLEGLIFEEGDDPADRVYASGDMEVTMDAVNVAPYFNEVLAYSRASIVPMEAREEHGDDIGSAEVGEFGTGPFQFVEANQDEFYLFERNPNYWREGEHGQLPYLDEVEIRIMPEVNSRRSALGAGDVHHAIDLQGSHVEELENQDDFVAEVQVGLRMTQWFLNHWEDNWEQITGVPLSVDLRKGLQYTANLQAINSAAYDGLGGIADTWIPQWHPLYDEAEIIDYAYGEVAVEEAQQHLEAAGWANPSQPMEIPTVDDDHYVTTATVLQQNLSEVGIDANVSPRPRPDSWDRWHSKWPQMEGGGPPQEEHSIVQDFGRGGGHIHFYTTDSFAEGRLRNFQYFVDDDFEAMIEEVAEIQSEDELESHYLDMLNFLDDEIPSPRLVWQPMIEGRRAGIHNVPIHFREARLFAETWLEADLR